MTLLRLLRLRFHLVMMCWHSCQAEPIIQWMEAQQRVRNTRHRPTGPLVSGRFA